MGLLQLQVMPGTFLLLALGCILLGSAVARDGPMEDGFSTHLHHTLAERLESAAAGGVGDCWSALLQLKSCTSEIILFFVNGESYLGMDCCRAIRIITHKCWPSMLSSIGFTAEEGDILRGYCDASASAPPPLAPAAATVVHRPMMN